MYAKSIHLIDIQRESRWVVGGMRITADWNHTKYWNASIGAILLNSPLHRLYRMVEYFAKLDIDRFDINFIQTLAKN